MANDLREEEAIPRLYQQNLSNVRMQKSHMVADCPFCEEKGLDPHGQMVVSLQRRGFFYGYFRCLNHCVSGGFPLWFARLRGLDPEGIPGYDPECEQHLDSSDFPAVNLNLEIESYVDSLTESLRERFGESGIGAASLAEMKIGFNGRYLVYPYFQEDGNCYAARCVFPDRKEDSFWHGNEAFFDERHRLFNVQEIRRCENGSLFLCEGEDTLLAMKQLGYPAVAVPDTQVLENLDPQIFSAIQTLFLVSSNTAESDTAVRRLASRVGYKVRPLKWLASHPKDYNVCQLAKDQGKQFRAVVARMVKEAKAFSPFATPQREFALFHEQLGLEKGDSYAALKSGFPLFDKALDGIHGINVLGGAPKAGKSTFVIQVATEMALQEIPVLYYDFENGRQKIYQRTLCRLTRLPVETIRSGVFTPEEAERYEVEQKRFRKLLHYFRVINDRQVTPEIMRRHIDFIRHETNSDFTIVVIDSLHKLPFKDFSERRTGIDAWLRQMESIRDEFRVSFLVISELSRGDGQSYRETPHLGVFKGSGDIEYSADNAMVLYPDWDMLSTLPDQKRRNKLWLVASREHSPGLVAEYEVDYPHWGFVEQFPGEKSGD